MELYVVPNSLFIRLLGVYIFMYVSSNNIVWYGMGLRSVSLFLHDSNIVSLVVVLRLHCSIVVGCYGPLALYNH